MALPSDGILIGRTRLSRPVKSRLLMDRTILLYDDDDDDNDNRQSVDTSVRAGSFERRVFYSHRVWFNTARKPIFI